MKKRTLLIGALGLLVLPLLFAQSLVMKILPGANEEKKVEVEPKISEQVKEEVRDIPVDSPGIEGSNSKTKEIESVIEAKDGQNSSENKTEEGLSIATNTATSGPGSEAIAEADAKRDSKSVSSSASVAVSTTSGSAEATSTSSAETGG